MKKKVKHINKTGRDIFDLENVDDLPLGMRAKIKPYQRGAYFGNILALFNIRNELTIDEVMVGLYRNNSIEKARNSIASALYYLTKRKLLERTYNGTYRLAED